MLLFSPFTHTKKTLTIQGYEIIKKYTKSITLHGAALHHNM